MGVLVDTHAEGQFSWIEYQALMLCLAGTIVVGMVILEFALGRFQVLPLLFPGMFSIRGRRFYLFDMEVVDGELGRRLHFQTKMLVRATLFLVLSYLWQECVLSTTQILGTEFPEERCFQGDDCFYSKLHFTTFFRWEKNIVDCSPDAPREPFQESVVITCIGFVSPSATGWLKALAIAHSLTQLNLKCYELLVWVAGNSPRFRHGIGALGVATIVALLVLFFTDIMREFVASWLSFVMGLSIPIIFWAVYSSGKVLQVLWQREASRVSSSIEQHLTAALNDFDLTQPATVEFQSGGSGQAMASCGLDEDKDLLMEMKPMGKNNSMTSVSQTAMNFLKLSGMMGLRRSTNSSSREQLDQEQQASRELSDASSGQEGRRGSESRRKAAPPVLELEA